MTDTRPIAFVFGTRPEIIKLSPVIRLCQRLNKPFCLVHTGQHYSYNMDALFFKELSLPEPRYKFTRPDSVGANRHSQLIALMESNIRAALAEIKPSAVLVQGDTDSVLAGARAAQALGGIRIGHVEAGLRSYDLNMPEEHNRIETDKLSDHLFAPTPAAERTLLAEGFAAGRIHMTGNTIVDALFENLELATARTSPKTLGTGGYVLVTLHRPETVDDGGRMRAVIDALGALGRKTGLTVLFPVHPRTRARLAEHGIRPEALLSAGIRTPEPMGFLEFVAAEKGAALIVTDSGGVQEEACILKVPCVTVRTTTERPETVEAGANVLAHYETAKIVAECLRMLERPRDWANPFGDGKASGRILKTLENPV